MSRGHQDNAVIEVNEVWSLSGQFVWDVYLIACKWKCSNEYYPPPPPTLPPRNFFFRPDELPI